MVPDASSHSKLQLDLLENGLDFVTSGIEVFFLTDTPDPKAHKYAILHIFAGVLLLLKERLVRVHPSLIFKDVSHYGNPRAKTTDYTETIARLRANHVLIDETNQRLLDR